MTSSNPTSLRQRLENLPQELYDKIFALTFTAQACTREVTFSYLPPTLLQVNRTSRQHFTKAYYGNDATFRFADWDLLVKWLLSLTEQSEALVDRIELAHADHIEPFALRESGFLKHSVTVHIMRHLSCLSYITRDSLARKLKLIGPDEGMRS